MVRSLYRYRGFVWRNAVNDLRHRYAGTGLGVVWNVLHPLALIAVYSLVFSSIMPVKEFTTGHAAIAGLGGPALYVLYLCSGFLPWLAFSECLVRGCNAFVENATYLKKLPVPEQAFVAQSAASATMGLGISFALLLAISLLLGHTPTWHWLLLPLPLVAMQVAGFGLGLVLGTLNVFFRDIGQFLTVALQIVMWTAPVVYALSRLPLWAQRVARFHPLVPPLEAVRDLFLYGAMPSGATWVGLIAWPAVFLLLGDAVFHPLRVEIRDNV
jgi:ABC-type polysaccharide/polyol phosphate export permease